MLTDDVDFCIKIHKLEKKLLSNLSEIVLFKNLSYQQSGTSGRVVEDVEIC